MKSSNDETNFSRKIILTNTQVSKTRRASSANMKFSNPRLSKIV